MCDDGDGHLDDHWSSGVHFHGDDSGMMMTGGQLVHYWLLSLLY